MIELKTEFQKLRDRWQAKTGEPMPIEIARLSIDRIRRAVELTESGQTVFVPSCPVAAESVADGIRYWDKDSEF